MRDSKLLQADKREEYAKELFKIKNLKFKICYCYPKTIDNLNIYQAARFAMARAISKLVSSSKYKVLSAKKRLRILNTKYLIPDTIILVDGPYKIKNLNMEQIAIVKGDRKVFAIACASILAKVFRDRMMKRYAKKFPGYGFEKNKGYGTKYHRVQLASFGPCKIHRRSFRLKY